MSNIAVFNPTAGLPAHLKSISVAGYTPITSGGMPYGQIRIRKNPKTKQSVLVAVPANGGAEFEIGQDATVCIVSHPAVGRFHFNKAYDENAVAGTTYGDCWSTDGNKPDKNVGRPHSSTCASCPFAVSKVANACGHLMPVTLFLLGDPSRALYRFDAKAMTLFNTSAAAIAFNGKGGEFAGWMPLLGSKAEPGLLRSLAEGTIIAQYVTQMMVNVGDSASLSFRLVDWLAEDHAKYIETLQESDFELTNAINPMPNPKAAGNLAPAQAAPAPAAPAPGGFGRPTPPVAPAQGRTVGSGRDDSTFTTPRAPNFMSDPSSPAAVNSKVNTTEADANDFNF